MIMLLSAYWKPISLVLMIGAFSVYIGVIKHERDGARLDRDAYKSQIDEYKLINANLNSQILDWKKAVDFQNQKISNMNFAFNAMQNRIELSNQRIQKITVESDAKITALKNYYESIPDSNACDALKDVIDAEVPTIH